MTASNENNNGGLGDDEPTARPPDKPPVDAPQQKSEPPALKGVADVEAARLCRLAVSLLDLGSTLQSTNTTAAVDDRVLREGLEAHLRAEASRLAADEGRALSQIVPVQAASDILRTGRNALERVQNGASASSLTEHERDALQAIIEVTGRPALRYRNGAVQLPRSNAAANEHWHVFIVTARNCIDTASRSVGRVVIERPDSSPEIVGTAWRLGDDLLVTNRHVAGKLVVPGTRDPSKWVFDHSRVAVIDFAATDDAPTPLRCPIVALEYCATEDYIDLAVLRLVSQGGVLPPALQLDSDAEAIGRQVTTAGGELEFAGAEVYVVGHPFRDETSRQIKRVFGTADGKKRCSPGYVTALDNTTPILEHDCSTLAGNSGSCVLSRGRHRVVGVHFGSRGTDENTGVADTNLAVALSRLGEHPVATILKTGRITQNH